MQSRKSNETINVANKSCVSCERGRGGGRSGVSQALVDVAYAGLAHAQLEPTAGTGDRVGGGVAHLAEWVTAPSSFQHVTALLLTASIG